MSLDVSLTIEKPQRRPGGSGIFIRQGGSTVEISREEFDRLFPGREPVMVVEQEEESRTVFDANITHNLSRMADAAGIYEALWRPAELDPDIKRRILEQTEAKNYHGPDGADAIERSVTVHARDLIEPLRTGLVLMKADPPRFEALNPKNGWGSYAGFVPWVEDYLRACEAYPDAIVTISR